AGRENDTGAFAGPFVISGSLTDAAGHAVPGAKIVLSGDAQAVRYTKANGSYTFRVNSGTFTVKPAGSCAFVPPSVSITVPQQNVTQNFVRLGCSTADAGGPDGGAPDTGAGDASTNDRSPADADAADGQTCAPPQCAPGQNCGIATNPCGEAINCG